MGQLPVNHDGQPVSVLAPIGLFCLDFTLNSMFAIVWSAHCGRHCDHDLQYIRIEHTYRSGLFGPFSWTTFPYLNDHT